VCIRAFRHKQLGLCNALADTLRMECKEWSMGGYPDPDHFLGTWIFTVDAALAVEKRPGPKMTSALMFAPKVKKWTWLVEKEGHFVFYAIENDDETGPLKLLSLDFAKSHFFYYQVGGEVEEVVKGIETPKRCKRLN
jgi:hypothetical protein